MKYSVILIFLILSSCKNNNYSDENKTITTDKGNTVVYYKNSFKNGIVKDSIAANDFDKGIELSSKQNYNTAKTYYELANTLEPNNTTIINALGNVNGELGDLEKAFNYFESSLKLDSLNTSTYLNYGFYKSRNDEFKKAIELYENGVSLESNGEKRGLFYYNMSRAYYQLYDDEKANFYIDKSIDLVNEKAVKEEILKFKTAINKK